MRARDQCSIFSTDRKFRPDYGLLLELHALTLVTRSYALLVGWTGVSYPDWKLQSGKETLDTDGHASPDTCTQNR